MLQFERATNIPEKSRNDAFVHYFGSRMSLDPSKTRFCFYLFCLEFRQMILNYRR